MHSLYLFLHQNCRLSLDAAKKMAEIMEIVKIDKGEVFVKSNSASNKEYIVMHGICRTYIQNSNDADVTLSFFTKHEPISPNLMRTVKGKSILNIQSLSEMQLATFATEDLSELMKSNREIEIWANSVLQNELINKVKKEINQISLTAKDRLIDFRKHFESLENFIPHSYIASYLGITNVSLSRIRKDLTS